MRNLKKLALIAGLLGLCMSLSGCMAMVFDVNINADYTGKLMISEGFSENTIKMLSESELMDEQLEDLNKFNCNDKTFYGETEEFDLESIDDLNSVLSQLSQEDGISSDSEALFNNIRLEKISDTKLVLEFSLNSNASLSIDSMITEEDLAEMEDEDLDVYNALKESGDNQVELIMNFTLPGIPKLVKGDSNGITIDGNKLSLDFGEIFKNEQKDYSIEIDMLKKNSDNTQNDEKIFKDVLKKDWYAEAIKQLADGKVVSGYEDGKFKPNNQLTIAEYSQIMTKVNSNLKKELKGQSSYWAYDAIKACIDSKIILNHGDIKPENYDVPITREEAIAGLQIALGECIDHKYTLKDIPDNEDIKDELRDFIVQAYNSGLTSGVDDKLTFRPKDSLTRAQICQLLYNIGWTKAVN